MEPTGWQRRSSPHEYSNFSCPFELCYRKLVTTVSYMRPNMAQVLKAAEVLCRD